VPWSGRFFLDEFDALLMVCLASAYARVPALSHAVVRRDALFAMGATLVGLSFAISAARGMWPLQVPDANAFNSYYSPYNALRIFKGALWALVIYRLYRRFVALGIDIGRPFAWGMVLGLALTVAVILWERMVFSGLWNFTASYRVTGPFSAMHTGGAYIEALLAVAAPFLVFLLLERRHWLVWLGGFMLLLATTYALMVTFSRNGYMAFAIAVSISLLSRTVKSQQPVASRILAAGLTGTILLVAVPIFYSQFAQSRIARLSSDFAVRQEHWNDALAIRDADWATSLFGMGLGRFPETSYWRSAVNPRSGTYRLQTEAGNTYLRLASGDAIYVEQFVALAPGKTYVLKLDVRPHAPNAAITVPVCEKWLLTSYNCIWRSTRLGAEYGYWRTVEIPFNTKGLLVSPWYSRRPIKMSLSHASTKSPIDVDNLRLEPVQGTNLLANGAFSAGLDHWFFAADSHLQWHVKSLPYGVLFDQGWFGLVSTCLLLVLAMGRFARNALAGDAFAGTMLAALAGFVVVGLFDTLIDAPRFLTLLLMLVTLENRHMAVHSRKSAPTGLGKLRGHNSELNHANAST